MMRKWIDLIKESQTASFILDPLLDPSKYEITGNMRDAASKWRAWTYSGFTATDPSKSIHMGDMADVGYIMISLTRNTIVPISRGDEHHRGYDLLYDLKVNSKDYFPIFCYGNNYVMSENELRALKIVIPKYLSYGGRDGPLTGTSSYSKKLVMMSDFANSGGSLDLQNTGELAPVGKKFYNALSELATTFRQLRDESSTSSITKAFSAAKKFTKNFRFLISYFAIENYDVMYRPEILEQARAAKNPIQALEEIFFDHGGLKRQIHDALREYMIRQAKGEVNVWKDDYIVALWGDVPLAIELLGRI